MPVASTHQSGRSAAMTRRAKVALRRSPNKAKQVAPDPDIPVSPAMGIRDNRSRTGAISGAIRIAAASRSLRLLARKSRIAAVSCPCASNASAGGSRREPGASPSAAKTFGVGAGTLGIDQKGKHSRQRNRWAHSIADTPHELGFGVKAGDNVRSRRPGRSDHPWIVDRQLSVLGEQPQSRRCIGRASTKPRRGRQSLD